MTNKQLDAIRDRVETAHRNPGCCSTRVANDLRILLDEVERLKNDLAMARQVSGELCEACGWAMKFPGESCRCELLAKVERLQAARIDSRDPREPKCRNLDCWLCHGTPANAGPR